MTNGRRANRTFSAPILSAIREAKALGIRAGAVPHRIIGIWMVVVRNRVFVRSWGVKRNGWYETLLKERRGVISIGKHNVNVRCAHIRSEHLKDAVSDAYAEKYITPWSRKYVRGFRSLKRKNATMELVPV